MLYGVVAYFVNQNNSIFACYAKQIISTFAMYNKQLWSLSTKNKSDYYAIRQQILYEV